MFDIAIIGCGPVGATLANQLGQAGLRVLVLERDHDIHPLPRAIHFDGEVMRVLQNIGLRDAVENVARAGLQGMHFVNAANQVLMVRAGGAAEGPHGCAGNYYFHQPELEAVLRRGLARWSSVKLITGVEVDDIEPLVDRVILRGNMVHAGQRQTWQARYLIGCDGARSIVRRVIGGDQHDLGLHQPWLVFDAILKRPMPTLPGYTVQLCDPARPMTLCNVSGARRRWEIMLMPGDDAQALSRPDNVWPLLARWLTPADAVLERSAIYTFHSVIASRWQSGRLLLAGDSAHQTPPFLGQGMCAGIRDAANLCWKLIRVCRDQAAPSLLDSYQSEREPHVRAFIELAVSLGDLIQATDPERAARRDRELLSGQTRIFNFPAPRLGPGIHCPESQGGLIAPQPRLPDGRRLDDAVGQQFALVGDAALLAQVDADTRARWHASGVVQVTEPGADLTAWMAGHGATAMLVRPDRYLVGLAATAGQLCRLSRHLPDPAGLPG